MPLNPNISLAYQPAQIKQATPQNPLAMAAQAMQLRNAMTQDKLAQAKLAQAGKPARYKDFKEVASDITESSQMLMDRYKASVSAGMSPEEAASAINPQYMKNAQYMVGRGANPQSFRQSFDPEYTQSILDSQKTRTAKPISAAEAATASKNTLWTQYRDGKELTKAEQQRIGVWKEAKKESSTEKIAAMKLVSLKKKAKGEALNPAEKQLTSGGMGAEIGKGIAKGMSAGDRSKVMGEWMNLGKSTSQSIDAFDGIIDSIEADPQIVTLGGVAAEAAESIDANLRGLASVLGFNVDIIDSTIKGVGGEAVKSASVRANIKKVVRDYARAKGESGKSLSDKDLVDFTQQITARWGNPEAILKVLIDRRDGLVDEFNLDTKVTNEAGFELPDIPSFKFEKRLNDVNDELNPPEVLSPEQASKQPKGTKFKTTDGRIMVVR